MTPHHEHEFEAAPGLPEALPAGERILWQGAPDWRALALHAFHVRKLAFYFAGMMGLQTLYLLGEQEPALGRSLLASALLASTALGLLALTAWLTARTALYTLTSRRVVMRIGIVLTITLNLPLRQLRSADLRAQGADGVGDLVLSLAGKDRIGWLHLWPHARPWHLADPKPSLRCIPQAQAVGEKLMAAWEAAQRAQPAGETALATASATAAGPASAQGAGAHPAERQPIPA